MNGMMNANYMDGSWMPYMHGPLSLIIMILAITATVWLVSRLLHGRTISARSGTSAVETLGQRFANGEIDEAEYKTRKQILLSK